MAYFYFLLRNMLNSVGDKYRVRFLEYYFYCYSQQIVSVVAKESLIPYNLTKRVSET